MKHEVFPHSQIPRCTLGEYWENHTCKQCPEHLYGDGVNCNTCPESWKVDKGFCHKEIKEKTAVAAFVTLFVFVCGTVLTVVGYRVRQWVNKRRRAGDSVKMSEIKEAENGEEAKLGGGGNNEVKGERKGERSDNTCCDQADTEDLVTGEDGEGREGEEEEEVGEDNVYESLKEMKSGGC